MLVFGLYGAERLTLEIKAGMTVLELRRLIHKMLNIPEDHNKHDKKVLVLSWAGADLSDQWVLSDLSIVPGTTIHINLKEEVKPVLYILCSHSKNTIKVYDKMTVGQMALEEVRSLASRETGLPVGIYRLTTRDGREMFDGHTLDDYHVDLGHTIYLENMDGWNKFLNLAIIGFTQQVLDEILPEETSGRYQMKVALFIAAHFGHVDLARAMLRQGLRASEPVGYPPQRMWCADRGHVESKKGAVHEAVEMGQMGVLRLFVNHDVTVITAKDGRSLAPLNIALRKKIKNCASFLLAKQWSKVMIDVDTAFALHIHTYTHLRQWCDRAKERVFMKYGQAKSSLKRRPFLSGPLVGFGVNVDGFSPSVMTGKTRPPQPKEKKKPVVRQSNIQADVSSDPESYFRQVIAVQNLKSMSERMAGGKLSKILRVTSQAKFVLEDIAASRKQDTGELGLKLQRAAELAPRDNPELVRLPPVSQARRSHPMGTTFATLTDVKYENQPQRVNTSQLPAPPTASSGHLRPPPLERERNMLSTLTRSQRKAFFMVRRGSKTTLLQGQSEGQGQLQGDTGKLGSNRTNRRVPPTLPKSSEGILQKTAADMSSIDTASIATGIESLSSQTPLDASHNAIVDLAALPDKNVGADVKTQGSLNLTSEGAITSKKRRKRQRGRVTSAVLMSKAAETGEGSIPLPLVSDEHDRRPFFYYNGKRERTFIEPVVTLWSHYMHTSGGSPRERAIKALSVAAAFKDKPWLSQIRIALKLTSNPLKRNVRLLHGTRKTLAM